MSARADTGFLDIDEQRLEYRWSGPRPEAAPTLVLLHEGLGCVGMWNAFPEQLAAATGCGVFAYSRAGYGRSSPVPLPRPLSYMHDEARETLPRLLEAIGFRRGVFIGQSDGASIAAIYAGSHEDHRIAGLVLEAPHFIVEERTVEGAGAALKAYREGDLRARLARWHVDVDVTFHGWNAAWIDPDFCRDWNTVEELAYIRVPMLIVQGDADPYGTARQIEIAQEECYCPIEVALMPGVGPAPRGAQTDVAGDGGLHRRGVVGWRHGRRRAQTGERAHADRIPDRSVALSPLDARRRRPGRYAHARR